MASSHSSDKPDDANEEASAPAARPRIYSEEDEEIRVAKAMALAIQNNPNMTPDELRQLTADLQATDHLEMLTGNEAAGGGGAAAASKEQPAEHAERHKKRMSVAAKEFRDKAKEKFTNIVPLKSFDESDPAKSKEKIKSPTTSKDKASTSKDSPTSKEKTTTTAKGKTTPSKEKKAPLSPKRPFSRSVNAPHSPPMGITVPALQDENVSDPKIRLAAILWKRRSGFGKLSSKNAWERRRVVLVGTKVSYFKSLGEVATDDSSDDEATTPNEGSAGRRASTWFEHAKDNLEKAKDNIEKAKDNITGIAPRGSLDLVKEQAVICATTGHSGAPSPFCISIKVRNETKWKFCFDSHAVQMEWLAALTDVVVTCSVDAYNAALVSKADPTHDTTAGLLFNAPTEQEPEHDSSTGHRLWMMEKYTITSQTGFGDDDIGDEEEDTNSEDFDSDDEIDLDTTGRGVDVLTKSSSSVPSAYGGFSLQGNNLTMMTILVNISLFYSRASSTGIDNFWTTVTLVNFALWMLVTKSSDLDAIPSNTRSLPSAASVPKAIAKQKSAKVASVKSVKVAPGFKPRAGTTTMRIENTTDVPTNADGHIFGGWRTPDASSLMVRSHGYLVSKEKVPSPGQLYTLAHADIFESRNQFRDMSERVILPKVDFPDDGASKTWHAPDVFVISVALPTDPPKMGRSSDDGGGFTITMYYTMTKETREILKRVTAPGYDESSEEKVDDVQKSTVNGVKLFNDWCRRAPTDPKFQGRFKLVAASQNLKEIGMPNWIAKYNGKPVLIKRSGTTGFLYNHPELNAMEFDISFHPFPYLAKQAICYMKDNFFKKVLVTFGFCIEGRADDELPECLIGLMQLCYPDPKYAIQAEDFFAGTSPKSY